LQIIQSFTKTGFEPFLNLWTAALLTAAAMIVTRCMSGKQARQSMNWCVCVPALKISELRTALKFPVWYNQYLAGTKFQGT